MTERAVQHAEQCGAEIAAPASAPAPMVERAFRVLDALGAADESLSLSELARALSMSKGSMHGLLKTLESAGAVEQCEDRRYALGPHLYDLARTYARRAGLRRFALPAMERLAARLGETILLGRVEQDGVRIVERVEARAERLALRISAERGTRIPLLAAATGRVVLASWPVARRKEYLSAHRLPRFTPHSLTDSAAYLAAVAETERTGIGLDREEYLIGVNAVAAPVHDAGNALVAVLWAVGFSARFGNDYEALERAGQDVHAEAEAISRALGSHAVPAEL